MRRAFRSSVLLLTALLAGCLSAGPSATGPGSSDEAASASVPHVVVATFDTGTNPFHPCWQRPGLDSPYTLVPDFPTDARPLNLTFSLGYEGSLEASAGALNATEERVLYYVPGTNLAYYDAADAPNRFVDRWPHGAQASSQIACPEYGMAPEALLVILNWYTTTQEARQEMVRWAADQAWIDVIHLNIQDTPNPAPTFKDLAIEYAIAKGKFVVIAAGNGVQGAGANYPMELSRYNGPPGSLIAGANDNAGYTTFSNLNPHVVMDGSGTVAAAPYTFGNASFGGTSSASPRTTGYVAHLLFLVREHFGYVGGNVEGVLVALDEGAWPEIGPLSDGELTVEELHEVVRRTADPNPHASRYDGNGSGVPQPVDLPVAVYAKMGYGEVSEHTIERAFRVAVGEEPMPQRAEDAFFDRSEAFRRVWWGT